MKYDVILRLSLFLHCVVFFILKLTEKKKKIINANMPVKLFDWLTDPYLSSNHEEATVAFLFWTNQFNSTQLAFISVQEDTMLIKKNIRNHTVK